MIENKRSSIHQAVTKINPFNQKNNSNVFNNVSGKRKCCPPLSMREFGKEISIPNNLTVCNNQESLKKRRTFGIPIEQKIHNLKKEKEELGNRLRNYDQLKRRRKGLCSSLPPKGNSNNSEKRIVARGGTNNQSQHKKNQNQILSQNQTQSQSLNSNNDSNEDINMVENKENISSNANSNNTNKNLNTNVNNKASQKIGVKLNDKINENKVNVVPENKNNKNEDVQMEIENEEIKPIISNPQNVDEYFDEIVKEIKNNEEKFIVDPYYMNRQSDINHRMRAILIDWLTDVHKKYKLLPQTLYMTVNLIDRYLEQNEISRVKLQLVGITAMFIATKYEEIYPPELQDFVYITDGAYVKSDVLHMEYKMLNYLNFNVTFPTQWSFLELYKRLLKLDNRTFNLAYFLVELNLINYKSLKYKMSHLVAAAVLIATKTLNVYQNNNFTRITGYTEKDLEECIKCIYDFNQYNSTHNLQAVRKKFASPTFDEVSKIKIN